MFCRNISLTCLLLFGSAWIGWAASIFSDPYAADIKEILASRRSYEPDWEEEAYNGDNSYLEPRWEDPDTNMLKALNGEKMKVSGGNADIGAYNNYPVSLPELLVLSNFYPESEESSEESFPEDASTQDEAALAQSEPRENPYPAPINPCPLPQMGEDGQIREFTIADGCVPGVPDTADFSKWFQDQQAGKADSEHNFDQQPPVIPPFPSYLENQEKRTEIRAKKGQLLY